MDTLPLFEIVQASSETSSPKTILIVEDCDTNMKLLRDGLVTRGYRVLETKDGYEAIKLARQHRPDLIVMDIQLPDVSGLEVTKWLKTDDDLKMTPVFAVTAFAMPGDEERIRAGGCDGYMAKPISIPHFVQAISRFLGRPKGVVGRPDVAV